jgi:predicted phage-related endonuclease
MSDHPTIGASQISALLGIHPWMTQHDVWKQLVHGIKQEDNEALQRGRKWEKHVLDMYDRDTCRDSTRNDAAPPTRESRDYLSATPDAWVVPGHRLVEAKTSSETWEVLPAYYHNQLQVQLYCWPEFYVADLAVLFPHFNFRIFPDILPDRDLQGQLNDVAEKFIKDYVLPKKLPPVDASESCRQAIIAQWPKEESGEYLEPSLEVQMALERIRQREPSLEAVQAEQDQDKNLIRAFIGDKAGVQFGNGYASFKRNKSGEKTDWEQVARQMLMWFRMEIPLLDAATVDNLFADAIKDFTRETVGARVLRIYWQKGGDS